MKRALLIGVPAFRRREIPDLPVIRRDLAMLEKTLHRSGYEDVRVRGGESSDLSDGTRSEIAYEIDRLCRDADEGDTLLVYLSSHGLHYEGRDYLVPSDAWWRDPRDFPAYLVPIDFAGHADDSRAHTLAVFIDACREGIDIGVKALGPARWSQGKRERARTRHLVTCFACQPGEYARYVQGDDGFSLFARALDTVLAPEHPARTLGEVCEAAQVELDTLARAHEKPRQHLRTVVDMEMGGESALDREICAGAGVRSAPGPTANPWTAAALDAELWNREEVRDCAWLAPLRACVAAVVDACWQVFCARSEPGENNAGAKHAKPDASIGATPGATPGATIDPWTDPGLPGRVVDALGLLCLRTEPAIALNGNETALAVIAPFVHEAALWSAADLGHAIENSRRAFPQIARKERRLRELGHVADADAIAAWLAHKARFRLPTATLPGPIADAMAKLSDMASTAATARLARPVAETLVAERVFALSRCVISEPTGVQRDDRPGSLRYEVPAGGHGADRRVREKLLGYLLIVAGRLAMDARMLSDVVVEHLGLANALTPQQVMDAVARATWRPTRSGLILSGQCAHPAVDLALRAHVRDVDDILERIHRSMGDRHELAPLGALPVRASADELGPRMIDAGPAYELPHVSFHLATSEVQELLMGEQLYGDPTLAIRELYQNALDACRYRHARLTYLHRTGQLTDVPWRGHIVFRQGVDQGRPYIECHDNGIGMDRRVIAESFARAGHRFHDSSEFIEEQIEWQRARPPVTMFPNSQFGIGVFGYFMLADEIVIETCRLDRAGRPGDTLAVHISGSGSLFRVAPAPPLGDAGTRVRLYLSKTEHGGRPISCFHTLRRELWVAEFTTETIEDGKRFVWRPGELVHPRRKSRDILATASPYLWWVAHAPGKRGKAERGAILVDGLLVDGHQPCLIVNLIGPDRPRLTVDRRRAVDLDRGRIAELAHAHLDPLVGWPGLDAEWIDTLGHEVSATAAQALSRKNT